MRIANERAIGIATSGVSTCARISALEADFVKIDAPVGRGKSESIVNMVARLIQTGADPAGLCVLVCTPSACERMAARLERACGADAAKVTVTVPLLLANQVLADRAVQGTAPRLLVAAEYANVLQDLRLRCGDIANLRGSVAKVLRAWADLADDRLAGEDALVRDELSALLEQRNAMLRDQAPMLAVRALGSDDLAGRLFDVMLADDFQNMSAASQALAQAVAEQLLVTGNLDQLASVDAHPNPRGFATFEQDHPGCQVISLTEGNPSFGRADEFCQALSGRAVQVAEEESNARRLVCVKWRDLADEFDGVASIVARALDADDTMNPSDAFVAVPNGYWANGVAKSLAACRLRASIVVGAEPISGDPRDARRCGMLASFAKLALAANPEDESAWRLWCSLESADFGARGWAALEVVAKERGVSPAVLLTQAAAEGSVIAGAEQIQQRFARGEELIAPLRRKKGLPLAKSIAAEGGHAFSLLCEPMEGDETPKTLFDRVLQRCLFPDFERSTHFVRMGTLDQAVGLNPRLVVVTGMVDGLLPHAGRAQMHAADERVAAALDARTALERSNLCNVVGKASRRTVLGYPQTCDKQLAEKLHINVMRSRKRDGQDLAVLTPSAFLREAGEAVPGAISGEQYLGSLTVKRD